MVDINRRDSSKKRDIIWDGLFFCHKTRKLDQIRVNKFQSSVWFYDLMYKYGDFSINHTLDVTEKARLKRINDYQLGKGGAPAMEKEQVKINIYSCWRRT